MSRLFVNPRSRSTLTSTHRPWQSNPFCQRWSSPSIAWNRWKTSLYARPQAWWTPIGLLAVIGPSRKLHFGPPAFWARSRSNVRRARHSARISCSWATRSGFALTGRNIGPRLGGSERADDIGDPRQGSLDDGRQVAEYPTRDAALAGVAAASEVSLRRRLPLPPLPRPRARVRRCLPAGSGLRRAADPGGRPPRRRGLADGRRAPDRLPAHDRGAARDLRLQPPAARVPAGRDRRRLSRHRLAQRAVGERRRPARPTATRLQPGLARRAVRRRPRHGGRPRRRRPLRRDRDQRAERPLCVHHRPDPGQLRRDAVVIARRVPRADRTP